MQPLPVDAFNDDSRGGEVANNVGDLQYQVAESLTPHVESIYGSMSGLASNIYQVRVMMETLYHVSLWLLFVLVFAFGWRFFASIRSTTSRHFGIGRDG